MSDTDSIDRLLSSEDPAEAIRRLEGRVQESPHEATAMILKLRGQRNFWRAEAKSRGCPFA